MEVPKKENWGNDWNERDTQRILGIARGMRRSYALSDRAAWQAAEQVYAATEAPSHRKGQLHAKFGNKRL